METIKVEVGDDGQLSPVVVELFGSKVEIPGFLVQALSDCGDGPKAVFVVQSSSDLNEPQILHAMLDRFPHARMPYTVKDIAERLNSEDGLTMDMCRAIFAKRDDEMERGTPTRRFPLLSK